MTATLLQGDARAVLATLPAGSVHMCVTSPPYWAQRAYQGVDAALGIGNEATPELWVAALVEVFHEVRRVLRDDGTLWLNVGDKMAGSGGAGGDYNEGGLKASANGTGPTASRIKDLNSKQATNVANECVPRPLAPGYKPKDMIGLPWMLAFALRADGWYLRSEIIWHKLSPFPQSVTDRPTTAHEQLFLLAKRPNYFYDAEAVRERAQYGYSHSTGDDWTQGAGDSARNPQGSRRTVTPGSSGRSARSVQTFAPSPFSVKRLGKYGPLPDVDHHALMPVSMATWCIRAGTSERGCCPECGVPQVRRVQKSGGSTGRGWHDHEAEEIRGERITDPRAKGGHGYEVNTIGWAASCTHVDLTLVPATVLDPFAGAGTTMLAAERLGRNSIGIELSPDYLALAAARMHEAAPMLAQEAQ